jgi:integrase
VISFVFKPPGRRLWAGRYRLAGDVKPTQVALRTVDKRVARQELARIVQEKEWERHGILPPKGLRDAAGRPLSEHLTEFLADLKLRTSRKYTQNIKNRVGRLMEACGWTNVQDVTRDSFVRWRATVTGKAPSTLNQYLDAVRVFLNWLVDHERVQVNPVAKIEPLPTRGREVRLRRAFTDVEMRAILAVAGDRAVCIRAVYLLGLRRGEAEQLQWGDVNVDDGTVSLRSATTKNRRAAVMPLDDLAAELRAIRPAGVRGDVPVFGKLLPTMKEWLAILRAAKVQEYDDQKQRGDFHALRYTLCTNLARAGVPVQTAMQVMRHSDIKLTTRIYTDAGKLPTGEARTLIPRFAEAVGRSQRRSLAAVPEGPGMTQGGTAAKSNGARNIAENKGKRRGLAHGGTTCVIEEKSGEGRNRTYLPLEQFEQQNYSRY